VIYLTKNAYEDINPITAYDPAYDTDGILVSNTSTAFTTLTTDWLTPLNFEKWSPASWSISTTSAPQLQY
jgi:hypothetical protein